MSRLGMPDLGLATLNDMRDNASMIASLNRAVPLIADADTGFGGEPMFGNDLSLGEEASNQPIGPLMVGRTVAQYMSAGVAALHLEDQEMTKRCGHLQNKRVVSREVFLTRIRAAVQMRKQTPGDILIIARTDAAQSLGYDAALRRLREALAEGADVAFFEGITSKTEARQLCEDLSPAPVLLNMAHGGLTPRVTVSEAQELGFKIVIFPGIAVLPVYRVVNEAMKTLKETGDISDSEGIVAPQQIFGTCGLQDAVDFDTAVGGTSYKDGV